MHKLFLNKMLQKL